MIPNILSIAGVDPSGGAGIAADLKTFAALGAYGMAAVTAVTVQNTRGVRGFQLMEPAFVADQIDAVFEDIRVDAVKIGMVGTRRHRRGDRRRAPPPRRPPHRPRPGDGGEERRPRCSPPTPSRRSATRLVPLAEVITPNLPEAAVLLGAPEPRDLDGMRAMARDLAAPRAGVRAPEGRPPRRAGQRRRLLATASTLEVLTAPRIATKNTHGTGCTLSSAIAALLPRHPRREAIRLAKDYVTGAIRGADRLDVGSGHGPLNHGYRGRAMRSMSVSSLTICTFKLQYVGNTYHCRLLPWIAEGSQAHQDSGLRCALMLAIAMSMVEVRAQVPTPTVSPDPLPDVPPTPAGQDPVPVLRQLQLAELHRAELRRRRGAENLGLPDRPRRFSRHRRLLRLEQLAVPLRGVQAAGRSRQRLELR